MVKAADRDDTIETVPGKWRGENAALLGPSGQSQLPQPVAHHFDWTSGNIEADISCAALGDLLCQRAVTQPDFQYVAVHKLLQWHVIEQVGV